MGGDSNPIAAARFPAALDTVVSIETPEGILLELRPAGLQSRLMAWLVDLMVRVAVYYVLGIAGSLIGILKAWLFLVVLFLLEWFYPVMFELSRHGATPGKRVMGLKVVMDNGLPVTPAASFARNLLRVADFLPMFNVFGAVSMLVRKDFKRLGDLAAGTLVVHRPQLTVATAVAGATGFAPARALTVAQRNALVRLAGRATRINRERLDELAALAAGACTPVGETPTEVPTEKVLGVARWLLGARGR